jgi:hypothetical protein
MRVTRFVHGGRPAASLPQEVALLRTFTRHVRANAVAYVALFVALSGTAVAAGGLARNSVGTAQLKNRAVTGRKVARKTLTGFNIRVRTLGTVPDASHLGHLPASAFQARVTGTCTGSRAISAIGARGNVGCTSVGGGGGTITQVVAGTDLTGGGRSGKVTLSADENKLQHRVGSSCAAGSAISSISRSGTVSCQSTGVTQMMGGSAGALPSGTTSFVAPVGLSAPSASESDADVLGSTVQSAAAGLSVRLSVPPGGSTSWRFLLLVNGGTALQCSIADTAATCTDTADRVVVPAGARVAFEAIPTGSPAAGARVMFGWTSTT